MRKLFNTLKGDYLQRSRSYAFLVTIAIAVYVAHTFVPPPEADYSTLNLSGYKGVYNSAWAGHISALMTTLILSLCGFYLVNGAIKKDIDTKVGLIIAATPITNSSYLFVKFLGNIMILFTISGITLLVGIIMFFIQNSGYPFQIEQFLSPYFFMVVPAVIIVSGLAVAAEVFLSRRTILQNVIYFFMFTFMITGMMRKSNSLGAYTGDTLGLGFITNSIKDQVNKQFNEDITGITVGYIKQKDKNFKTFEWNGPSWNINYVAGRLIWIGLTCLLVYISSFFFHRFDFKQTVKLNQLLKISEEKTTSIPYSGFQRSALPEIIPDYGIIPFIKTELLLMIRKDAKWLWIINIGLWIATLLFPLLVAYSFFLPALFFMQVNRISDLATKEVTNRLHYFTFASYKPLRRLLSAQILAGFTLLTILALPLILRLLLNFNFLSVLQVLNGIVFIVALSVCLGMLSGGKKLFEILFFLLTYIAFQEPDAHYLGKINNFSYPFLTTFLVINIILLIAIFLIRKHQIRTL
ncbi:hypothetical protein NK212_06410 [Elizabethkingia sp. S0634]|uniref:hypothetical protein n=1 Tax=Elizabethkingia sp. S0634 TaxID=2957806 RepID=UPI0020A14816|nr:hypothetical protein [Elizabethkingia sp. S0634]MCP1251481.1 hypothetical protein [Elizabethkingia sp. S0634]